MSNSKNSRIAKAEKWLLYCLHRGLAMSYDVLSKRWVKPYPEVTGYLVSYFCRHFDELDANIWKALKVLLKIQHPMGGFCSFSEIRMSRLLPCLSTKHARRFCINSKHPALYTFDTGKIMHALLSAYSKTMQIKFLQAARRAGNFMISMQLSDGSMYPMYDPLWDVKYADGRSWGSSLSIVQVKNVEEFLLLYNITKDRKIMHSAKKLCEWGKKNCMMAYTHPGGYYLEGLWAIGEHDFVKAVLVREILSKIQANGFLPYGEKCDYAYVCGSIQMGILLFKCGFYREAEQIMGYARRVQHSSGGQGLCQYGKKDGSIHSGIHAEINSWGTVYFCELERLHQ